MTQELFNNLRYGITRNRNINPRDFDKIGLSEINEKKLCDFCEQKASYSLSFDPETEVTRFKGIPIIISSFIKDDRALLLNKHDEVIGVIEL